VKKTEVTGFSRIVDPVYGTSIRSTFYAHHLQVRSGILELVHNHVWRVAKFGTEKLFVITQKRFYKWPNI
jgi:hypothetical protein